MNHETRTKEISTNAMIASEGRDEKRRLSLADLRTIALGPLLPYRDAGQVTHGDLTRLGVFGQKPTWDQLQEMYGGLEGSLKSKWATTRTLHERYLRDLMISVTRLEPKISFWIGPFNADLFFYQVGGEFILGKQRAHGLVLEVDGEIHDGETKMKKDGHRLEAFSKRGIMLHSIRNEDVKESAIHTLFRQLKLHIVSDHKARRRLLMRLYIWTLFSHLSDIDIEKLFSLEPGDLRRMTALVRGVAKGQARHPISKNFTHKKSPVLTEDQS